MKLEPRKATDRGGWLCMPLVINRWRKTWLEKGTLPGMRDTLLAETGECRGR